MHYADGTPVKLGDLMRTVVKRGGLYMQQEQMGVVVGGLPESNVCNLQFQVFALREVTPMGDAQWHAAQPSYIATVNAYECHRIAAAADVRVEGEMPQGARGVV